MRRIVTVEEMSGADKAAIAFGVPSLVLMERAALSVVDEILAREYDTTSVLVLCGSGNNGGDGAAIARILAEKAIGSEIMLFGDPERRSDQLKTQLKVCEHYHIPEVAEYESGKYTLIVDAVFGIGLHRDIQGNIRDVIEKVNNDNAVVVAVDISSGIQGNTGKILGCAVRADLTVTFAAAKPGHYLYPGASYSGEVVIKEIGIPIEEKRETVIYSIEEKDLNSLPKRDEGGNKGTFGKLLVIAGSKEIFGAAYLAAKAALKCGIGMVKVFTEETNRTALNVLLPEALISTYKKDEPDEAELKKALKWADSVVIGPGIGTDENAQKLMEIFLKLNDLPVVFDADALNLFSKYGYHWQTKEVLNAVTPHLGEMGRLTGRPIKEIKEDLIGTAVEFSVKNNVVCILKDAGTVVAYPDRSVFINTSGCSALATAGSGDVLSGVVGAYRLRYGKNENPTEAMAVYVHGLLGNKAAEHASAGAVIAGDLLEMLNKINY